MDRVALAPVLRGRVLAAALATWVGLADSRDLPLLRWRSTAASQRRGAGDAAGRQAAVVVGGDCPVLLGALAALQEQA